MRKSIQRLLDRDISSNSIATHTGVGQAVISKLRNGKRSISGLSIESGEKLYRYEKELEKMEKVGNFIKQNEEFVKFMDDTFEVERETEDFKVYDLGNMYNCLVTKVTDDGYLDVWVSYKDGGKIAEEMRHSPDDDDDIEFIKEMVIAKSKTPDVEEIDPDDIKWLKGVERATLITNMVERKNSWTVCVVELTREMQTSYLFPIVPKPIIESNKVDELFNFEHHGPDSQKLTPYINDNKYHFVKLEDGFQKFIELNQDLFDEREKMVERMKNE